jgi:hypothetical protein
MPFHLPSIHESPDDPTFLHTSAFRPPCPLLGVDSMSDMCRDFLFILVLMTDSVPRAGEETFLVTEAKTERVSEGLSIQSILGA